MQVHLFFVGKNVINFDIVQRVHWLRARAQFMRWQEEVKLTTYEMQWTVSFFVHYSHKWEREPGSSAGHSAYFKRKQAMWQDLAISADRAFRLLNADYKSSL